MTSNDAAALRYRVIGCLTKTSDPPRLSSYIEARGAALVRECAAVLAQSVAAGPINAEELAATFAQHGVSLSALEAGLHSVRISAHVLTGGAVDCSTSEALMLSLIDYLIEDFALLERWIVARKGPLYPTILFGDYRTVPMFEGGAASVPVTAFLQDQIASFGTPFELILVDDGASLRITPAGAITDTERLRSVLAGFAGYHLWVLLFSR